AAEIKHVKTVTPHPSGVEDVQVHETDSGPVSDIVFEVGAQHVCVGVRVVVRRDIEKIPSEAVLANPQDSGILEGSACSQPEGAARAAIGTATPHQKAAAHGTESLRPCCDLYAAFVSEAHNLPP